MLAWLHELDRVIRGDATRPADVAQGEIPISGRRLAAVSLTLAMFYGLCMGFFAVFNRDPAEWRQPVATMLKAPALFFLTLVVTSPSLYVFNALVGSRLGPRTLARLMMATLGVTTAVLASFGTIVLFFTVTTPSYPFILMLNVVVFAGSGLLGLQFLFRTMLRLTARPGHRPEVSPAAEPSGGGTEDATAPIQLRTTTTPPDGQSQVRSVFIIWMVVFALVGAQMSWVLRPFLGHPDAEFTWFRPRASNFFEAVAATLRALFS